MGSKWPPGDRLRVKESRSGSFRYWNKYKSTLLLLLCFLAHVRTVLTVPDQANVRVLTVPDQANVLGGLVTHCAV